MDENPLTGLYVDDDFDQQLLADALQGTIGLDPKTGDPRYLPRWTKLSDARKVVGYLLYRRAAVALGHISVKEVGVESRGLAETIGVNNNSLRSYLSRLDFIEKDTARGGHYLPSYAMQEAIDYFQGGNQDD